MAAVGATLPKVGKVVDDGACPNPPVGTTFAAGTEVEDPPNWNTPAPPEVDEVELPPAAFPPKVNTFDDEPGAPLFSLELPKGGKDDALAGGSAPNAGGGAPVDFEPPPKAKLEDAAPLLVDDEPPNLNTSLDEDC